MQKAAAVLAIMAATTPLVTALMFPFSTTFPANSMILKNIFRNTQWNECHVQALLNSLRTDVFLFFVFFGNFNASITCG